MEKGNQREAKRVRGREMERERRESEREREMRRDEVPTQWQSIEQQAEE